MTRPLLTDLETFFLEGFQEIPGVAGGCRRFPGVMGGSNGPNRIANQAGEALSGD